MTAILRNGCEDGNSPVSQRISSCSLLQEIVALARVHVTTQRVGCRLVRAGRAAEPEIDTAGEEGFERPVAFGDRQRARGSAASTPPAPTRMRRVADARRAMITSGALEATDASE